MTQPVDSTRNFIEKEVLLHIKSTYKFVKRILLFISGDPVGKHERDAQYKSVSIFLNIKARLLNPAHSLVMWKSKKLT
jgi:hypothetical protein